MTNRCKGGARSAPRWPVSSVRQSSWNGASDRNGADRDDRFDWRLEQTPGVCLFEDLRREFRVQRMARTVGDEMADDRVADERQVADGIEDLVADEFVLQARSEEDLSELQ